MRLRFARAGPGFGASKGFSMTAEYFGESSDLVSRFSVSTTADVTIHIAERDGHQFIVIKEQHPAETSSATQQMIEIPVALLPELKRADRARVEYFCDEQASSESIRRSVNFAHQSEE